MYHTILKQIQKYILQITFHVSIQNYKCSVTILHLNYKLYHLRRQKALNDK